LRRGLFIYFEKPGPLGQDLYLPKEMFMDEEIRIKGSSDGSVSTDSLKFYADYWAKGQ